MATKDKTTKAPSATSGPTTLRIIFEWVKSIGIAIFLAMLIRWPIAEPFKIPSGSMEPTFFNGDRIFVNKHAYGIRFPFNGFRIPFTRTTTWYSDSWLWNGATPERWDIVVFKSVEHKVEHDTLVKRVVALPGETVQIVSGRLLINGEPVEIPDSLPDIHYTYASTSNGYGLRPDVEHSVVPEDHVFVLGDNSAHSRDARWFGWLPKHHILGEVTSIWYPMARWRDFTGFTTSPWWTGTWTLLAAWLLTRMFLGRSVRVYSGGLAGILARGEHVFIRFGPGFPIPFTGMRLGNFGGPKRGDVVLYRPPGNIGDMPDMMLGIIAGLPEERVAIEKDQLQVNGKLVSEPLAFKNARFPAAGQSGRYGLSKKKEYSTVPEDHSYILADEESEWPDSRVIGWVSRKRLVGPARWVWWPLTKCRRVGKS